MQPALCRAAGRNNPARQGFSLHAHQFAITFAWKLSRNCANSRPHPMVADRNSLVVAVMCFTSRW